MGGGRGSARSTKKKLWVLVSFPCSATPLGRSLNVKWTLAIEMVSNHLFNLANSVDHSICTGDSVNCTTGTENIMITDQRTSEGRQRSCKKAKTTPYCVRGGYSWNRKSKYTYLVNLSIYLGYTYLFFWKFLHSKLPKFWQSPKRHGKNTKKSFLDITSQSKSKFVVSLGQISFVQAQWKSRLWLSATVGPRRVRCVLCPR